MFYDFVLLRRQNQGRFAMAWVASTRGIKTAVKEFGINKIRDVNINALCEEIMEYLRSASANPKERVSLRMAVHLIEGTIVIFHKKVSIFEEFLHREFTCISTFPRDLSYPGRGKISTQRGFKTPPTPIIIEKAKKRRSRIGPIPEEFPKQATEGEALDVLSRPPGEPSEFEARKESLYILESQPLRVELPDDVFGEFDAGPSEAPAWGIPPKPPSQISEKSQLEKIEEQLIVEALQEQQEAQAKTSSISPDAGPLIVQVEALVHKAAEEVESEKKKISEEGEPQKQSSSSSGVQEGPAMIVVEAMVHRSAEGVEGVVTTEEQPAPAPAAPELPEAMEIEEIQTVGEAVQAPMKEISKIPEEVVTKKKRPLRVLQKDEIPSSSPVAPKRLTKEEREKREKEEKITKNLRLKFKPAKRILRLNDNNKMATVVDFPTTVFQDRSILHTDLAEFLMSAAVQAVPAEVQIEQMRQEGSSTGSINLRVSKVQTLTPKEPQSKSSSQHWAEPSLMPVTGDFMSKLDVESIKSTPLRTDPVELPHKRLYTETRIEYEIPVQETIDRQGEKLIDVQPIFQEHAEEEFIQIPPTGKITPIKKIEDERRKNTVVTKLKEWSESEGYLLVDDLIPEPKNKLNAAKTFYLLLTLAKEELVEVMPERNSLEAKYVKRGKKLLI